MTRIRIAAGLALIVASGGLSAQMPGPREADSRIQSIAYRDDQVVRIRSAPGYQVTIELASDERVASIALGDSSAFQVTANKAGNLLFVKPAQADVTTNMIVVTDVRTYNFDLAAAAEPSADMPYAIRFSYPLPAATGLMEPAMGKMIGNYRLGGHRSLWPDAISDDGARTYIDWPADGPLPACYSRDEDGRETLLNGNMRGVFFVIDGVHPHLIFRLDRHRATAARRLVEGSR